MAVRQNVLRSSHPEMAREARLVAEAVPYHITQRGNNRQDIFLLDEDRRFYIEALKAKAGEHGLTILGWCLMTNHVHLVAIPQRADSLARAIGQAHWRYTMRFNRGYGRSGHLWQGRFYSCPLGPTRLVTALAYVDLNPWRAGLVGRAAQYPWSSAATHGEVGGAADPLVDDWAWGELGLSKDRAERLEVESAGRRNAALRQATFTGLPFGNALFVDALFVEEMEERLKRRLRPKPPGRPRKKQARAATGSGA